MDPRLQRLLREAIDPELERIFSENPANESLGKNELENQRPAPKE
jgi:hypothetical protein